MGRHVCQLNLSLVCRGWSKSGDEYDLSRPLESFAEGVLIYVRNAMDSMFYQEKALADMIEPFHVDVRTTRLRVVALFRLD